MSPMFSRLKELNKKFLQEKTDMQKAHLLYYRSGETSYQLEELDTYLTPTQQAGNDPY